MAGKNAQTLIDEIDARPVGEPARNAAPTPPIPNASPKKSPEIIPIRPGSSSLRVNDNRRKRRRQNHANDDAEHTGPEQVGIGQHEREWKHAQDRTPDHVFAADAVTHRSADDRPGRYRAQKNEQMDFGTLHRNVESADEIKV